MTNARTSTLASLIKERQACLHVSDRDLATALGYDNEPVVELIKQGRMRLPINKVKRLADALALDPRPILRAVMAESAPGLLDVVEDVLDPLRLTDDEERLIKLCRRMGNGREVNVKLINGKDVVALIGEEATD